MQSIWNLKWIVRLNIIFGWAKIYDMHGSVRVSVTSTFATGSWRHEAQTSAHTTSDVGLHQPLFHQSVVPSRIRLNPAIPNFGPLLISEPMLIIISSSGSRSDHTSIFLSCSYVRKNWTWSKGTLAGGSEFKYSKRECEAHWGILACSVIQLKASLVSLLPLSTLL